MINTKPQFVCVKRDASGAVSVYVDGVLQPGPPQIDLDWGVEVTEATLGLYVPLRRPFRARRYGAKEHTFLCRAAYGGRKGRRAFQRLRSGEFVQMWTSEENHGENGDHGQPEALRLVFDRRGKKKAEVGYLYDQR